MHGRVAAISICEAIEGNPPEEVTAEMKTLLKSKAKPYATMTEIARWWQSYGIIFPEEDLPSWPRKDLQLLIIFQA